MHLRVLSLLLVLLLAQGCADDGNKPPVFTGLEPEVSASVGDTVSLFVNATDPEGKAVTLTLESGPSDAQFLVTGLGRFVWEPKQTDAEPGGKAHNVVFRAVDADGIEASFRVVISVFPSEGDIRFVTSNSRVLVLERTNTLKADVTVQADNKTEVELSISGAPEGMSFEKKGPKTAEITWTPTPAQIAKKLIWSATLTAEPGSTSEVTQNLSVTLVPKSCGEGDMTLQHKPLGEQRAAGDYSVEATIRDSRGGAIEATMFWRVGGDPNDSGGFEGVQMASSGDTFTATIPNPEAEVDKPLDVYYFIVAVPTDAGDAGCIHRVPDLGLINFPAFAAGDDSCRRDRFEPNEASGDAITLAEGTEGFSILSDRWELYGLAICPGDVDVYAVDLEAGTGLSVLTIFSETHGELLVRGLDPSGTEITASDGLISGEATILLAAAESGTHYIEVTGADGSSANDYRMLFFPRDEVNPDCVDTKLEPNESQDLSIILPGPDTYTDLKICEGDKDYFAIDVPDGDTLTVELQFLHADGDIDLQLKDRSGTVANSFSETDNESATVTNVTGSSERYYIEVRPALGATNDYTMVVTVETGSGVQCDPDFLEPNDTPTDARQAITEGLDDFTASMCTDVDYYALDLTTGQQLRAEIASTVTDFDLDIEILDPSEQVVASNSDVGSDATLSWTAESDGTHYVHVFRGSGTGVGDYTITVGVESQICAQDSNELNDARAFAFPLDDAGVQLLNVGLCAGDSDYFTYQMQANEALLIDVTPTALSGGDPTSEIEANIVDGNDTPIGTSEWSDALGAFLVDYTASSSERVYLKVTHTASTGDGYQYDVEWITF